MSERERGCLWAERRGVAAASRLLGLESTRPVCPEPKQETDCREECDECGWLSKPQGGGEVLKDEERASKPHTCCLVTSSLTKTSRVEPA